MASSAFRILHSEGSLSAVKEVRLCGPLSDARLETTHEGRSWTPSALHGCRGNQVWQQDPDSNFRTGAEPSSFRASQVALMLKSPSANAGDVRNMGLIPRLGRSLGWEDPLKEGVATHFSTFAWRIPWTEEPGGLQSLGSQRVRHNWSD